jgi:hypothetical protein
MGGFGARLVIFVIAILQFSSAVIAGTLDEYYLQQFGEIKNGQLQKAALSVSADVTGSARCGLPLKKGLRRDWNLLEQSTQKVLAKQLALSVLSGTEQTLVSPTGKFKIHYTNAGADAVPSFGWVQTVAQTFDDVAAKYTGLGWRLAPTLNNSPYDIYLNNQAAQGFYGVTNSDVPIPSSGHLNAYTSWMELDNDFAERIFTNPSSGGTYLPLQSLQITAAHEYHHAIQYGYNYYFDIWYAESTSTWMEDELYDSVNQLYNYIPAWFTQSTLSLDITESTSTGGGYGRWIFNRYLAEKHQSAMIRGAWESLANYPSPSGLDISMTPILDSLLSSSYAGSLGADFFGFAKRVYTKQWTSHTSETGLIHSFLPVATYSTYPVNSTSTDRPAVTLPHYSFAYYKFIPALGTLAISVSKTSGIQTAVFKKVSGVVSEISGNTSYVVDSFGATTEVVLLVANITSQDGHSASFSTDGTLVPITEPTPLPVVSGSSNSCFVATAAYGSYLHPQVQLLRDFRDRHLLTNAPGRTFVTFYYRHSPPLADFIAKRPLLRGLTRLLLTPVVVAIAYPFTAGVLLFFIAAMLYRPLCRRYHGRFVTG